MGEGTEEEFYEISAVSRLTGLSKHVLRVWEKRYGVVEPDRSQSQRRLYSQGDIHRLTLLKSLVDNGHTISSVANLEISALEERLAQVLETKSSHPGRDRLPEDCRVGFVGVQARIAVRDAADVCPGFTLVAEFCELSELVENIKPGYLDILVVEAGSLFPDDVNAIQTAVEKLGARRAVVIYQFASKEVIEPGSINKITALRAPVTSAEILLASAADVSLATRSEAAELPEPVLDDSPVPERVFSAEQLHSVSKIASVIQCECPRHLASLLSGLAAFEEYSRQCENRNEADAKLHAFLYQETANCRLRMEKALQHLLEAENIRI